MDKSIKMHDLRVARERLLDGSRHSLSEADPSRVRISFFREEDPRPKFSRVGMAVIALLLEAGLSQHDIETIELHAHKNVRIVQIPTNKLSEALAFLQDYDLRNSLSKSSASSKGRGC